MIPSTRYGRPHRQLEGLAFGEGERWRPLRLVLDNATLTRQEVELLVSFSREEELDLWHTAPDVLPRLEMAEPFDTVPAMGGALSIRTLGSSGSVGLFGIYGTERLRHRARELAEAIGTDEDQIFHSLVFASASDESDACA